ncbi:MAG TPA: imidazole glycerol phosphate synthase subunit HisH [Clostridia bacterium]
MKIKIVDYKAGNSSSVMHAIERLGFTAEYAKKPEDLADATHIILPGVGSAKATMDSLNEIGLLPALEDAVIKRKVLYLGICIGMQIIFEYSEEGDVNCLGWLKGKVIKFNPSSVRVPQMGWNYVKFIKNAGLDAEDGYYYFVNSYHALAKNPDDLWATAEYGVTFTAAVNRENIFGTQFHIEKSGELGLKLLKGFLTLKGDRYVD